MAEDLAPIPTPTIDPPTKNPKVEGLRTYYKSIGADGDSFAKKAYETYQSDSAQAEKVLDSHLRNAYKEKSSSGLGDISAFPSAGAPPVKKPKATPVSAPVEKPVLSASDNVYQASKPTNTGQEGGAIETFLRTALGNIAPNLTAASVKIGSTVAQQILKGVEMISAINPDGLDSPMSKWARDKANELRKSDENFLANSPYTQKQLPSKGQDKAVFQDGKISLDGTAGMLGDAVSQIPSMLLSAVATRGASVPAQVASMWAVGTLQAAPGMYAESRKNGLSPEASDLVGYTASAVASAVDVLTGGEAKLIGLSPSVLRTASTKILGKSLGKASAVIDFINGTSVSQALKKVGINKFELGQLDAPTLQLFQTEMQNTKMGLMKKFGGYISSSTAESLGEGISATAEKGTQWMYDKLLSEDGSSVGKGQFGVEWNDRHTWEDIGNEAAAGFGTGLVMNVAEFRGPNTAQTMYGAMEASTRLNGDAGPVVSDLTNEVATRLRKGQMSEEAAYSAVQKITRMGQVATTLAERPDLTAQNKFDLFNISDRHLNPTDGSQVQKAQRVEQASQIIGAIDTAMQNPALPVEEAAVMAKQRSDTLSALGVSSIEQAQAMLSRREKFLTQAKDSIIAGKPSYGNLNNGLKVAETFREGDIIRGLVNDSTTSTKRNEVATIASLSEDGQIATTDKGEQINLQLAQKADADTVQSYIQQKQLEEAGQMPENAPLADTSWRERVTRSVPRNGGQTTFNRVPLDQFDESGAFVDSTIPSKQEALKGKTILLNYPTGEETAKFMGYDEDGNAMLSSRTGDYVMAPATLWAEADINSSEDEGGLFAGIVNDNDVDAVNEQLDAENFKTKPQAVTTTKPVKKTTQSAPIPLTQTEAEALAEVQAQTAALSDAMREMASEEEGAVLDGLERILSEIKPGDASSYLRAAKKVLSLGELFDETADLKTHTMAQLLVNEANAIQSEIDKEAVPFTVKGLSKIEINNPNGKEQNRGGVAEGESQDGGNQAEGTTLDGQNGQPTLADPSQNQESETIRQPAEDIQTGQSGNQSDSLQSTGSGSNADTNSANQVIDANTDLATLAPLMDEMGMLSRGVSTLLSAIHSFPNSIPVEITRTVKAYEDAGGTYGEVVTKTDKGFLVNLEAMEALSAKGLSEIKAWMTGVSISQNETHPMIGELAAEAVTGAYSSKKFAEQIENLTNPVEIVQAVLGGAVSGNIAIRSTGGRPTGLLAKLMAGSNVVERADKDIYSAILKGWKGAENSFSTDNVAAEKAQLLKIPPVASTTETRSLAGKAVAIIKAKFPAVNVAYASSADFFARFGVNAPAARLGNSITLNEASLSGEGPVHELGHIWGDVAEKYYPALHDKLITALKGTKYESIVNEFYPELTSDSDRNSEMLAQAIGVRGERFLTGSKLDAFKDAFDRLMVRIADRLGITGKNISQMKANALVDEVAKSLLTEENNSYISEMAEYMNGSLETEAEPQFLKIARPEVASQRTLEKALGTINPVGINRNPYSGDVPDDVSFSDIGLSKFDAVQQKKLLGMYTYPDGSISKEKTKNISGKDVKGKKVSEDRYLKELITTEKDAILDGNNMPSRSADDMPPKFDGLDDLSRYALSDEQLNNYLHNYYPNGDLSEFVFIPKDKFKADNDAAATKLKDSYVLQSIAGETAISDIAMGLTNVTNMTKLLGLQGGVVRETMEGVRPAVLAMSNELGLQNKNQLDDLLEKYSSWSTFRQTGSEDTAQSIDLGNMMTGSFSVSGKTQTSHKLTKAQAASLAFTLKSLFDDGHVATHITLPKGERSKQNEVFNMILDETQAVELMNNIMAEPGMQDLYDSVDNHNKIVAEYLDKVHYMTEGSPMPKTKGFYWALKSGENYFTRDGLAEGSPRQILNASIIQDRQFNKDTFYAVSDAFEHLQNNFRLTERYVQLAPYSHVMENALHNITESSDNNGLSVVRKNLTEYVKWATNLKSMQPTINFGGKFNIGWVFKNKARFALNGNPFVVLKQIPTFFALALDGTVSPADVLNLSTTAKYAKLLAGSYTNTLMGMGDDNASTIFGHTFEATDEADIRRIASNPYQLETYQRLLGTVTPDVDAVMALRSSGASKIQNLSLVKNKARKLQDEHLSAPMKRADVATVIIADVAARRKVERDMPGATQEEKNKMIGKLSNQLVRNTHATYDILDRPHYATSEDTITKAFMMFQSQTGKAYNRWLSAHIENEQSPSARTKADLNRQILFLTTITPAVMVGTNIFRKLIMGAVLGDDKWEKFMENPWGNAAWEYARNLFSAIPGIPSAASQFILSLVDNENWTDDLFDVNVLSPVSDFVAAGVNTAKGVGEDKYTKKSQADKAMFDGIKKVMRASAQLNGIPSIAEQIAEKRVVQPLIMGEEKAKRPTRPQRQRAKYSYLDMQMGDAPDRVINR